MDSLMSSAKLPDIDTIDYRDVLYYGKYRYRARFSIPGISYMHGIDTMLDYLKRLEVNRRYYDSSRIQAIDLDDIETFIDWKNANVKTKTCSMRIEGGIAGIFSNDLALLHTLRNIAGPEHVNFTEIVDIAPTGVKTFVKQPKHNYRVYLKSKRVKANFKDELSEFINRYKNTKTVIVPSDALRQWLKGHYKAWHINYCSAHYYIEFDEESTNTLLSMMFGDMIKSRYKLEKRQD